MESDNKTREEYLKEIKNLETEIDELIKKEFDAKKLYQDIENKSEELFKKMFETSKDGMYLSDLNGNFLDGNKEAEHLIGYSKDELVGKSFLKLKLLSIFQIPKATSLLAKNALGKSTGPDEFALHGKDGKERIVNIMTFPFRKEDSTFVLGVVVDLAKRKMKEAELEAKKIEYEARFDKII